jgi:hypothetical protein
MREIASQSLSVISVFDPKKIVDLILVPLVEKSMSKAL